MKLKEKLKNLFGKTKGRYHWFIGNRKFFNYVILHKDTYEWLERLCNRDFEHKSISRNYVQSEYKIEQNEEELFFSIFREEKNYYGDIHRIYVIRLLQEYHVTDEVKAKAEQVVKLLNEIRIKKEDIPDIFSSETEEK